MSAALQQRLLADDPYAQSLGIRWVDGDDGSCQVEMTIEDNHLNFAGVTHGGVVFSLADCAFSLVSNGPGRLAVAIDTHLVLPAGSTAGAVLRATARQVYLGNRIATYRVEVTSTGEPVGLFTGTVHRTSRPH